MNRFALTVLLSLGVTSVADAGPIQRLRSRIQQRPVARKVAAPVRQAVQAVARPVTTVAAALPGRVCGPGGCR